MKVFIALPMILLLAGIVFWIWSLVDALRVDENEFRRGNRTIWVLVIALTQFVGSVLYVTLGRPRAAS